MHTIEDLLDAEIALMPDLPEYADDENECFHPVAFAAARLAFRCLGDPGQFFAEEQYRTPAGPADMTVVDHAGMPWLPVEIKKRPGDVRGKGRRQANDYRENLSYRRTQLYVSTNLELFEVFRFDAERPGVSAQRLDTEFAIVGSLEQARRAGRSGKRNFYWLIVNEGVEAV